MTILIAFSMLSIYRIGTVAQDPAKALRLTTDKARYNLGETVEYTIDNIFNETVAFPNLQKARIIGPLPTTIEVWPGIYSPMFSYLDPAEKEVLHWDQNRWDTGEPVSEGIYKVESVSELDSEPFMYFRIGTASTTFQALRLTTDRAIYDLGDIVSITVENIGDETVDLSSTPGVDILNEAGVGVWPGLHLMVIDPVSGGDNRTWTWDQKDWATGEQVSTGCYKVETASELDPEPLTHFRIGTPRFEEFGPRADKVLFKMFANDTAEWAALEAGEIDLTDVSLDKTHYDLYTQSPFSEGILTISHGPEFSFRSVNINSNNERYLGNPPNPEYPNPVYPNPCSVREMRQAISHLVDRSKIDSIIGPGFYRSVYTPIPLGLSEYAHPEIRPGGALEELTYPYNPAEATALLDAGGFITNPETGWRFWDLNQDGKEDPDEYLELKFCVINEHPHGVAIATSIIDELRAVNVRVKTTFGGTADLIETVWGEKDFHIFTCTMRKMPDLWGLYHFFHSDMYWHPGFPPNAYTSTISPEMATLLHRLKNAKDFEEAKDLAYRFQEVFAENAIHIPLWSYVGVKGLSRCYVGTPVVADGEDKYKGRHWEGIVNMIGYGADNYWSFLNMHPEGFEWGDGEHMTIRYGYDTTRVFSLNPIYSNEGFSGCSSHACPYNRATVPLHLIYESLLQRNPYNPTEFISGLAENWTVDTYEHPRRGKCTKVRFTIRPDATWTDGTPVTVADVYFTLVELDSILESKGLPPPWGKSFVMDILDFKILDKYNFEVLFNGMSIWALSKVGQPKILPKHIWKPICETGDVTGFAPDPNMIGSGPYRLVEYVEGNHILMVANKPGSAVTTNFAGSTQVVSPKGYWGYLPLDRRLMVDGNTMTKIDYYTQPHTINIAVTNDYLGPITVDLYHVMIHANGTEVREVEMGILLNASGQPGDAWTRVVSEVIRGTAQEEDHWHIVGDDDLVCIYVQGPYEIYSTIRVDIAGSFFDTHVNWQEFQTGDGSTSIFTTTHKPIIPLNEIVVVDGVLQTRGTDYTIDFATGVITFITAPASGSTIAIFYNYVTGTTGQFPAPDIRIDILDIVTAAAAFGSYPGHPRWSLGIADIDGNYFINIIDIVQIAMKFGWAG